MIHPCDGQTDGRAIAYSALSILCYMLSRAKNCLGITSQEYGIGVNAVVTINTGYSSPRKNSITVKAICREDCDIE